MTCVIFGDMEVMTWWGFFVMGRDVLKGLMVGGGLMIR